ncbi:copper amine oxidase N-terminal domain-containing protein [Heliorestis convoluta]|uniref:Copper amine oxidase N-terminal domain-containing protein n=1 Tax=Heliorestis convoluta TaxID=356322 RepID=A0A5Q2N5R0_9FIRM|nr:copper amine oxidase N-terminal domain-containing protein [Heliorestis convoluta]QGG48966.1 copper amine oxidase N-terminal domain-containing protein [Heliorestis convoluta]
MKKSILILIIILLVASSSLVSANDISVSVNGESIVLEQSPIIEHGRTLVPLRAIFEALGAEVTWNGETRTVTGTKDDIVINLQIENTIAIVNNQEVSLDVPAMIMNGRTLVPLRFIAESLGAEVSWDGKNRVVLINYNKEAEQQRLEQQRLEQQRLEQQRLEQQRLEQQRLDQQRLEQQRLEQQRLEQTKIRANKD